MRRMYSEKQIQKLVQEADWSGVDLKVNTIEQDEPNWELDLDLSELHNLPADCEVTNVYSKIIQWNRELHIIFNFKITNNGASTSLSFNSTNNYIELPEAIAERIIDFEGKSVKESSTAPICAGVYNTGNTTYPTSLEAAYKAFVMRNLASANKFALGIHDIYAINAGTTLYISGRISIDLA